jgi:hypothetical protein
MSFEIEEFTKARLDDIEVLSQKNRQPDEAPGVKLHLEMTLSNHVLSTLDGALKGMLFTRNEAEAPKATKGKDNVTGTLDGVDPVSDLPNLSGIGSHIKSLKWADEVTGCSAIIRFATTELGLDDTSCGPFTIKPKEGGTCVVKFPLEAPNASEKVFAKLAKYKSREIELKIKQHAPADDAQQRLDDARDAKASASKDPAPAAKTAPDKAAPVDEKKGDPGDFENNPFRSAKSDEAPPQSATTEVVPDKPAGRRAGRRAVVMD